MKAGAVYRPVASMLPPLASTTLQVTGADAVNICVVVRGTVAGAGVTVGALGTIMSAGSAAKSAGGCSWLPSTMVSVAVAPDFSSTLPWPNATSAPDPSRAVVENTI